MREEIEGLKLGTAAFFEPFSASKRNVRAGLVVFGKQSGSANPDAISFGGNALTDDPAVFRAGMADFKPKSGSLGESNALEALAVAARQPFRSDAEKVLVLISDKTLPAADAASVADEVQSLNERGVHQLHLAIEPGDGPAYAPCKQL